MTADAPAPPTTRPSRAWLVYFALLVVLGCVALLAPVLYNQSLQLKPEQLDAARQKWAASGLRDYDLDYRVQRDRERADVYHVEVRQGRAVRVICNGQFLLIADLPTGLALGAMAGLFRDDDPLRQTVEGILDHLEGLATRTQGRALPATQGRVSPARDYCVAQFHPDLGYPVHFVYRVAGTTQRQEWTIQLNPVSTPSQ